MVATLEKTGIAVVGRDVDGKGILDFSQRRICTRIWPRITGSPVTIYVGAHETADSAVTYDSGTSFTPGTDEYVDIDPPANGRLIAVKFETTGDVAWELEGYDLDLTLLGDN
jgi:hypothetical protein